jgi:hypothetical protein
MIDSSRQWSYAVSDRMTGCPVCSLCQMAAVSASTRWSTRTITPLGVRRCRSVDMALEGLADRLDDLPQRLEQLRSGPLGLALAGRTQQLDVQVGQLRLEFAAEVVLVADQPLAGWQVGDQRRFRGEDVEERLAFVGLRPGQRERDRQPAQRAQQVQPKSPEVAGRRRPSWGWLSRPGCWPAWADRTSGPTSGRGCRPPTTAR